VKGGKDAGEYFQEALIRRHIELKITWFKLC
jgi:hypothetical protein